jgi:tRNA nucleotidyltransferase (CCA-adding enzyme)
MKSYVVGGAVRDRLLGLPGSDRDHVVVGATTDEMLAAGFKPVGRDFPVFLHPVTHEEYALARTERKVAPGYAGFVFHADPSVTLEADLERRDLTINAMAEDDAGLVDPYGGQRDLALRLFRHVGPAFVEDPVRVLRVARFAARFTDFHVAPETLALMRRMTDAGEVDALVAERVWQEVSRGLMEQSPSRMITVLQDTGAFARLFPEIAFVFDAKPDLRDRTLTALDRAAHGNAPIEVRFAVLLQCMDERGIDALCTRFAVPKAVREVALLAARERETLLMVLEPRASAAALQAIAAAIERSDAFRRGARFMLVIEAIAWTLGEEKQRTRLTARFERALAATSQIDAGRIARDANRMPGVIAERVRAARNQAIIWSFGESEVDS